MAKSARQAQRLQHTKHRARAERRLAERTLQKQQRAAHKQRAGRPLHQMIGGLITILVIAGIVVFAVIRANQAASPTSASGPALTAASDPSTGPRNQLPVGTRAPGFALKDVNGKAYSLALQQGHPVVLEFFAVWCPHCQAMAPIFQKLDRQYASKGVRFWQVLASPYGPNYDNSYGQDTTTVTKADVQNFAKTYHEYLPKLVDPRFKVVDEYGINGFPGIYVIDKNGIIRYSDNGQKTYGELSKAIAKVVTQK
jgi:peroxiredoxin